MQKLIKTANFVKINYKKSFALEFNNNLKKLKF